MMAGGTKRKGGSASAARSQGEATADSSKQKHKQKQSDHHSQEEPAKRKPGRPKKNKGEAANDTINDVSSKSKSKRHAHLSKVRKLDKTHVSCLSSEEESEAEVEVEPMRPDGPIDFKDPGIFQDEKFVKQFMASKTYKLFLGEIKDDNNEIGKDLNNVLKTVNRINTKVEAVKKKVDDSLVQLMSDFAKQQAQVQKNTNKIEKNAKNIRQVEQHVINIAHQTVKQMEITIARRDEAKDELIFKKLNKENLVGLAEDKLGYKIDPKKRVHMRKFSTWLVNDVLKIFNEEEFKFRSCHVNRAWWLNSTAPDGSNMFVMSLVTGMRDQILNELDNTDRHDEQIYKSLSQQDRNKRFKCKKVCDSKNEQHPGSEHVVLEICPGRYRPYDKKGVNKEAGPWRRQRRNQNQHKKDEEEEEEDQDEAETESEESESENEVSQNQGSPNVSQIQKPDQEMESNPGPSGLQPQASSPKNQ